jgi:methyltransferase-like protein/2-polyprenyl-3-methyl-5-hydroxy-6-metoxy-1,4-benzoquinol methylase
MSIPGLTINPYDEIPFPSQPLAQSHPDRVAAIGLLFGMQPPPAQTSRVLELGCATGGNLIPMAERLREARFVGVDYSQAQVLSAQRTAAALQLSNIELLHADIADLGDNLGQFDYIICHGVLSWVPPALQDKILTICRRSLSPQGIAYVSYNVYPAWHARSIVREMLMAHVGAGSATEKLARGKALLSLAKQALERESTAYARLLKNEIDLALRQPDGYVFHEYMEANNYPLYLHEFVERAQGFELAYLGDAAVATMFASNFGPAIERQLLGIADDVVGMEQHLDLLRNRGFRQSLLCHREVPLVRKLTPKQLEKVYFRGRLKSEKMLPDLKSNAPERFTLSGGLGITTPSPALKAVLQHLGMIFPRAASLDELTQAATRLLSTNEAPAELSSLDRENLGHNLVQCVASGLLDIQSAPDSFITQVSPRPEASPMARFEAGHSNKVTNRCHELIDLDDATRNVLRFLDGQHDRAALVRELVGAIDRGDLSVLVGGLPATRGDAVSHALEETLDASLTRLAHAACLVA